MPLMAALSTVVRLGPTLLLVLLAAAAAAFQLGGACVKGEDEESPMPAKLAKKAPTRKETPRPPALVAPGTGSAASASMPVTPSSPRSAEPVRRSAGWRKGSGGWAATVTPAPMCSGARPWGAPSVASGTAVGAALLVGGGSIAASMLRGLEGIRTRPRLLPLPPPPEPVASAGAGDPAAAAAIAAAKAAGSPPPTGTLPASALMTRDRRWSASSVRVEVDGMSPLRRASVALAIATAKLGPAFTEAPGKMDVSRACELSVLSMRLTRREDKPGFTM